MRTHIQEDNSFPSNSFGSCQKSLCTKVHSMVIKNIYNIFVFYCVESDF